VFTAVVAHTPLLTVISNSHIQDVLMVAYLSNLIRTQIDLSNRMATAALTLGTGESTDQREGGQREGGQKGGQDQRRGRRG
jgi:translation initiation factor 3 subunit F